MCYVQRVVNTCGHRNDHVFLLCRFARAGYQLAVPISDPNSNLSCPNTTTKPTTATPTSPDNDHGSSPHQDDNDNENGDGGDAAFEKPGFHACTEPYCVYASVRTLDSPVGFRCMVEGCGRVG